MYLLCRVSLSSTSSASHARCMQIYHKRSVCIKNVEFVKNKENWGWQKKHWIWKYAFVFPRIYIVCHVSLYIRTYIYSSVPGTFLLPSYLFYDADFFCRCPSILFFIFELRDLKISYIFCALCIIPIDNQIIVWLCACLVGPPSVYVRCLSLKSISSLPG